MTMYSCYLEGGPGDKKIISVEHIGLAIILPGSVQFRTELLDPNASPNREKHEYKFHKKIGKNSFLYKYSGEIKHE